MRAYSALRRAMGHRPPAGLRAVWGVCALAYFAPLALSGGEVITAGRLHAQTIPPNAQSNLTSGESVPPAGTPITNVAAVQYKSATGKVFTTTSSPVTLEIGQVAGVELEPPGSAAAPPGGKAVFSHLLRNLGNGSDSFVFSYSAPPGWTASVFADVDGDGLFGPGDTPITGPVSVDRNGSVSVFFVVQLPQDMVLGSSETVVLWAESVVNSTTRASVTDVIEVHDVVTEFELWKTVDRPRASPGEIISYTLGYRVSGEGYVTDLVLRDEIPSNTSYLAGSLQGSGKTPAAELNGLFFSSENRIEVSVGSVLAGVEGEVTFQVQLADSLASGTAIRNQARADYFILAGPDSAESEVVETVVSLPELTLEKTVEAPDSVTAGDTVSYTILVRNPSTDLTAREVFVTDTIPDLLVLEEVEVPLLPTMEGRVVVFPLHDLTPGDSVALRIRAMIAAEPGDQEVAANRASLVWAGGLTTADSTRAIPLFFDGDDGNDPPLVPGLALVLSSPVLEVSLGQRVPVHVGLANEGSAPLDDLRVDLTLPDGTEFVEDEILVWRTVSNPPSPETSLPSTSNSATTNDLPGGGPWPADSVQVRGREVSVFVPGSMEAGDSLTLRYTFAILSAPSRVLETYATAQALWDDPELGGEGVVFSDQEMILMRAGRNSAMETTTVLGKVWLDLDGDGSQSDGEEGVPDIDLWTEDGELVTTDGTGKFSFVNLRPGRHGIRIDPETIPDGFRVAGGVGEVLRLVEVSGWTSPRVSFGLVPVGGMDGMMDESSLQAGQVLGETTVGPGLGSAEERLSNGTEGQQSDPGSPEETRLSPLRSEDDRAVDKGQAFLQGPGVEFFHPVDGVVLNRDRVFVGVRGEPGRTVSLFVGDSLLSEGEVRPDGIHDFIGVPLATGPQILKVKMLNSWGSERWDSLVVHVSGLPREADFTVSELAMDADGQSRYPVTFLVTDQWGVPVSQGPTVTLEALGARIVSPDADPSSVGHQVKVGSTGEGTVVLQAGREVGSGVLIVNHQDGADTLSLDMRAAARPFMLIGVGNMGVGAGSESFGSVTARGRLGESTSVTVSYDSRRLDEGRRELGRITDPLGEGQYAILGDASEQRSVSASRYAYAARLERNQDWLALGDLQTAGFAEGLNLSRYTRALPGLAGRFETGRVTWQGFGALTTQILRQAQLRGDGSSGPYALEKNVLPGTERVSMEVRALENATRVVSRKALQRYVDYQVDYETGTILLKSPVPAADPFGNPVFLMVTYEAESGGDRSTVWGGRATIDLAEISGGGALDAMPFGVTFVQDDLSIGRFRLMGGDLSLRKGNLLRLNSEVARASSPDSTDVAVRIEGGIKLFEGSVDVTGRWLHIGDQFRNPANRGLLGGTEEVAVKAGVAAWGNTITLEHQEQKFGARDLTRSQSLVGFSRAIRDGLRVDLQVTAEEVSAQGVEDDGGAGQLKVVWKVHPRFDLWAQGRRQLWSGGDDLVTGDFAGTGATWKLTSALSLEARHLRVSPRGDRDPYSVTNLGVRSELASGAKAWGTYQLNGGIDGPTNAAVLGLSHTVQFGSSWSLSGMLERRKGVRQAPLGDNVLALPFGGEEEDYWSTGFGVEHLPDDSPYRLSARGEVRGGAMNSSRLLTMAGDMTFDESLAALSRQEMVWTKRFQNNERRESRRVWSLWGLAFRPVDSDALNGLLKLEWREDKDPGGAGVLNTMGSDRRLIATAEVIWAPTGRWEIGGRYSLRRARTTSIAEPGLADYSLETTADFFGARGELDLFRRASLRVDLRLLAERNTGSKEWDVAPSLVLDIPGGIELQGGYRFGGLQDPDFLVRGGEGAFMNIGTRLSERTISKLADFWRTRIRQEF